MTVTATAISGPYDGDDSDTVFTYTFVITQDSELKVTLADTDGLETVQTLTTHYTVQRGSDGTGTWTMVTAPATGEKVVATLNMAYTQATNLLNKGQFFAETHEAAFDKMTRLAIQNKEEIDRSVKVGPTTGTNPEDVVISNLLAPVLLASATASTSSTLEVVSTNMSIYDTTMLEIVALLPSASSTLYMRLSEDAGSTWLQGVNDYAYVVYGVVAGAGAVTIDDDAGETFAKLTVAASGTSTVHGIHGIIYLSAKSATNHGWIGQLGYISAASGTFQVGGGAVKTTDIDGVQLYMDSGTLVSGTIRLWGIQTGS